MTQVRKIASRAGLIGAVSVIVATALVAGIFVINFLHGRPVEPPNDAGRAVSQGNDVVFRGTATARVGRATVREVMLFIRPRNNDDFSEFTSREIDRLSKRGWDMDIISRTYVTGDNVRERALLSFFPISTADPGNTASRLSDDTLRRLPALTRSCPSCVVARISPRVA